MGRRIGDILHLVLYKRARIVQRNLEAAFPEMYSYKHQRLRHCHFRHLGEMLLDDIWSMSASDSQLCSLVKFEGAQHFPAYGAAILMMPHTLGGAMAALQCSVLRKDMIFSYKEQHSRFWDSVFKCLREGKGGVGISTKKRFFVRDCVRHIKKGGVLLYLPDINPGRHKHTLFAPFLGVENTATSVHMKYLAKLSGYSPVVPYLPRITDDGYVVTILPPMKGLKDRSDQAFAEEMNRIIETHVREAPATYFWLHRRFKTRPPNETADFYH